MSGPSPKGATVSVRSTNSGRRDYHAPDSTDMPSLPQPHEIVPAHRAGHTPGGTIFDSVDPRFDEEFMRRLRARRRDGLHTLIRLPRRRGRRPATADDPSVGQGGEPEPVCGLVVGRARELSAKARVLVAQHEQFGVLCRLAAKRTDGRTAAS
ncbi:hypothetical protein [Saccharothrix sp. ALI-22-I]|uniref:hypothetical protein n=1 Tax=Saccharothrix sp. ALI-22-I TaxID=1933778 RepID=UPI0015C2FA81|nr:hypothetical protein [Saccharothrix sp. ALI-22-I]